MRVPDNPMNNQYRNLKALVNAQGFTLVELLVSIVIIGALAAIALPSYLNQVAKARGSEAKANMGSLNRSQQAYRWEHGRFTNQLNNLDVKLTNKYYNYSIVSGDTNDTRAITISQQPDLKVSSGAVSQNNDVFSQIICESVNTQSINTSAAIPTGGSGLPLGCPSNYTIID
jgi:type IV pilus assembly protein PilA